MPQYAKMPAGKRPTNLRASPYCTTTIATPICCVILETATPRGLSSRRGVLHFQGQSDGSRPSLYPQYAPQTSIRQQPYLRGLLAKLGGSTTARECLWYPGCRGSVLATGASGDSQSAHVDPLASPFPLAWVRVRPNLVLSAPLLRRNLSFSTPCPFRQPPTCRCAAVPN